MKKIIIIASLVAVFTSGVSSFIKAEVTSERGVTVARAMPVNPLFKQAIISRQGALLSHLNFRKA